MTKILQPQVLDVVITKITAKTVYYKLSANQRQEKWRIPSTSKFDKSQLIEGARYRVISHAVFDTVWHYKTRQRIAMERFDWISAAVITPKAKIQARSAKQRKASELHAAMPFVDNGVLIKW